MSSLVTIEQLQNLLDHGSPFTKAYAFVVKDIAPGACTIEVPALKRFERPDGITSGQVLMSAADVAMWLAIKTLRGLDDPSVTSDMQTHFLDSVRGEPFLCTAVVRKLRKRTAFGTAECLSMSGEVLAHHTLTFIAPAR